MAEPSQAFLQDRFADLGNTVRNRRTGRVLASSMNYPLIRVGPGSTPKMLLHRVLWIMRNGSIPEGYVVDHRDGDPLSRVPSNLRLATRSQNQYNRKPNANCKLHPGVYTYGTKGRRYVKITSDKTTQQGGVYSDYQSACDAADALRAKLHGDFRRM